MNAEALGTEEEIMDAYRGAVAHAKGEQFASMLQVSHAGGWFTVRDLEGTESRYRRKEIVSLTRSLLKQPKFGADSQLDLAALVEIPRQVPPPPPKKTVPAQSQTQPKAPKSEAERETVARASSSVATTVQNRPRETNADGKIAQFPLEAASPGLSRKLEKKAYVQKLWRIVLIVATIVGFVVLVVALKRH